MENPLVQLSLNNARILGGMYVHLKHENSIRFHFAECDSLCVAVPSPRGVSPRRVRLNVGTCVSSVFQDKEVKM